MAAWTNLNRPIVVIADFRQTMDTTTAESRCRLLHRFWTVVSDYRAALAQSIGVRRRAVRPVPRGESWLGVEDVPVGDLRALTMALAAWCEREVVTCGHAVGEGNAPGAPDQRPSKRLPPRLARRRWSSGLWLHRTVVGVGGAM